MPLPRRKPRVQRFPMELGGACGPSIREFYVLAWSSEYDEAHEHLNPPTFQSPTSRFTHIFHYRDGVRDAELRINDDLLAIWQSNSGETLAAGFPRGVFHVSPSGVTETVFKGHEGAFTGLWGPSSEHVFACGMGPFALYRLHGSWQPLPLPPSACTVLQSVFGFAEHDVYFVGNRGTIFHYDGRDLVALEVPTTRGLRWVGPLGRKLCVAGEDGTLLYGDRHGFRHVPTGTRGILNRLGAFQDQIYFGTESGLWRFDGRSAPALALTQPAQRVSSLGDGLLIQHGFTALTWDGTTLTPLDTVL